MKTVFRILFIIILAICAQSVSVASQPELPSLEVDEKSFGCLLDMHPVRSFFVDNLYKDKLKETIAVAEAGSGQYPAGSVVQLIPGEVMVKHPEGFNQATRNWEFFELDVSAAGSKIRKRGFVDVVNRFNGNCFDCHVKAKTEFDMICETGHGCDPLPVTRDLVSLIQKMDPRCERRYQPTAEERKKLQALANFLSEKEEVEENIDNK